MTDQQPRNPRTFSGMLGAMAVLVLIVLAVVGFQDLKQSNPTDPVTPVDYLAAAKYADGQAKFVLAAPAQLPPGWMATSVSFTPGSDQSWHLGMLTGSRHYVGVEQAFASARTLVDAHVDPNAVQGADVTIDGVTWQTWTDARGDTALVHETPTVSTLVVGTIDEASLISFIKTLPKASVVPSS